VQRAQGELLQRTAGWPPVRGLAPLALGWAPEWGLARALALAQVLAQAQGRVWALEPPRPVLGLGLGLARVLAQA